jgi:hypothetical protein
VNFRPLGDCLLQAVFAYIRLFLIIINYIRSPNFWATFFHGKSYAIILTKYRLSYIFGDFLQTNLVTLIVAPPNSLLPRQPRGVTIFFSHFSRHFFGVSKPHCATDKDEVCHSVYVRIVQLHACLHSFLSFALFYALSFLCLFACSNVVSYNGNFCAGTNVPKVFLH